jgi:hypothetical protein
LLLSVLFLPKLLVELGVVDLLRTNKYSFVNSLGKLKKSKYCLHQYLGCCAPSFPLRIATFCQENKFDRQCSKVEQNTSTIKFTLFLGSG